MPFIPQGKTAAPAPTATAPVAPPADVLSPAMSGLKQEWNTPTLNPAERLGVMVAGMGQEGGDMLKSMGIRGGATALGQVIGRRFGGKLGERAGGVVGAVAGDSIDQARRIYNDPSKNFSYPELAGDATSALFLGKSTAGQPINSVAAQSALSGAGNAIAANVQSVAGGNGLLPVEKTAEQFGVGSLAQLGTKPLDRGVTAGETNLATVRGDPMRRVLSDAKDLNLVVPPVVSNPSIGNKAMHMLGGGSDVVNAVKTANAPGVIQAIRDELGFRPDQELSLESLNNKIAATKIAWKDVENSSPEARYMMEQFKDLNAKERAAWSAYNKSQIKMPEAAAAAKQIGENADAAAELLKENLTDNGKSELWDKFNDARKLQAQAETAKMAISPGGNVNADIFGNIYEASPGRLTGKLLQLGRVQSELSKYFGKVAPPSGGVGSILKSSLGAVPRAVSLSPVGQAFATPFYGSTAPDFAAQVASRGLMAEGRNN